MGYGEVSNVEQHGKAIGRITSPAFTFTFASGSTVPAESAANVQLYAGGIIYTPAGHTGTIYYQEGENENSLDRLGDDTGTDLGNAGGIGGRKYSMPAAIFPAWFIRPELGTAPTASRVYRMRFKG